MSGSKARQLAEHNVLAYLWYSVCDLLQTLARYDLDTHSALGAHRCAALTTCVEGSHLSHKLALTADRHQVLPRASAKVCRKLMGLGGSLQAEHEGHGAKPDLKHTFHMLQQMLLFPVNCQLMLIL